MQHVIRRLVASLVVICISGVGLSCTDAGGESDQTNSTTTTPMTTENVVTPSCEVEAFTVALGEESGEPFCVTTWAVAQPLSYSTQCSDCESLWLFQWEADKWELRGTCYQFAPLTADSIPCSTPDGSELREIPPPNIACMLWPANTSDPLCYGMTSSNMFLHK